MQTQLVWCKTNYNSLLAVISRSPVNNFVKFLLAIIHMYVLYRVYIENISCSYICQIFIIMAGIAPITGSPSSLEKFGNFKLYGCMAAVWGGVKRLR